MTNGGAFGPKLSGKTTLASRISKEHFEKLQIRSLILDPHTDEYDKWHQPAIGFITPDEDKFWPVVWKSQNCLVIVEEAATTISRNRDLVPVFTRLRHCHHKLFVVGHSGMDLLPVMRQQIDTIYLFRQPVSSAKVWAEVMTEDGLLESTTLGQFEFIKHRLYGKPARMKLPPPK